MEHSAVEDLEETEDVTIFAAEEDRNVAKEERNVPKEKRTVVVEEPSTVEGGNMEGGTMVGAEDGGNIFGAEDAVVALAPNNRKFALCSLRLGIYSSL
jgi:hypothetical protein